MNLRLPPCEDGTLTAELPARKSRKSNAGLLIIAALYISDSFAKRNTQCTEKCRLKGFRLKAEGGEMNDE